VARDEDGIESRELEELVAASRLDEVHMVAWRDLDDPEAGGSELHAHRVASRWAEAGLRVSARTSAVPNAAVELSRDGYSVVRRGGRYGVFGQVALEGLRRPVSPSLGVVEIWNGMPFFSPLWFKGPRIVFLHHVHGEMWEMALSKGLAMLGNSIESGIAPRLYRSSTIVTLSESSKEEIVERLRMPPERVHVVPPGIEARFTAGGELSSQPSVVAVGRLVPVKRFDLLLRQLAIAKRVVPELTATIIGEGYERGDLEALRSSLGADEWISMPGRVSDAEQVAAYRSAWLVASSSLREGWGMTLTEAAACGTPSVATDIAGHRDAVRDGTSGILVADAERLSEVFVEVLGDEGRRSALAKGALDYAESLTWERTATETFRLLDQMAR